MNNKASFLDRLRFGKHKFFNGEESFATPHKNPDGTIGGWVAETCLVDPTAYIAPTAEVIEYAQVRENARILGESVVSGFAQVRGEATLDNWATVTDESLVEGSAVIGGITVIAGRSHINHGVTDDDNIHEYLIKVKGRKLEIKK